MSGTSSGGEAWTEIVCCPECRSALAEDAGGALLRCVACGRSFPVEDRIARILPARLTRSAQGTARCFSFEWRTLGDVLHSPTGADAALRSAGKLLEACGLSLEALAGRRVLDAGCGNGGYAAAFESLGAEVTGVDLSLDGLARARARVRDPRARFVQGDLLSLPLLPGQFDVAFSLGVLHHTGDPEAALRRCAEALRPGGVLIAGVYSPVPWLGPVYAALRSVTTRLPLRLVWALSSIGAPLGAFPLVGRLACPWMSRSMSWKARWLDTFDWYAAPVQSYHTLDEVRGWFERTGILKGIEVASRRFGTLRARRTGSRDVTGASGAFPGLWPGGDGDG